MRLLSFSEFEMISQPFAIITVVATTDVQHVACMQELASAHHVPPCFSSGQYDPAVPRIYVLLHDVSSTKGMGIDPIAILKELKRVFPAESVKLLSINSFPEGSSEFPATGHVESVLNPTFLPAKHFEPLMMPQPPQSNSSNNNSRFQPTRKMASLHWAVASAWRIS